MKLIEEKSDAFMGVFYRFYLLFMIAACSASSCSTTIGSGLLSGSVLGASVGGLAGGGPGALIGGTAGLIAGGFLGAVLDPHDRKVMEVSSPRTLERMDRGDPLTINDVIKLSQGGVCDEVIIRYLYETKGVYTLSRTQVHRLQEAGVSQRVINHMIEPLDLSLKHAFSG